MAGQLSSKEKWLALLVHAGIWGSHHRKLDRNDKWPAVIWNSAALLCNVYTTVPLHGRSLDVTVGTYEQWWKCNWYRYNCRKKKPGIQLSSEPWPDSTEPRPLTPALVTFNINAGEGMVNLSRAVMSWTLGERMEEWLQTSVQLYGGFLTWETLPGLPDVDYSAAPWSVFEYTNYT